MSFDISIGLASAKGPREDTEDFAAVQRPDTHDEALGWIAALRSLRDAQGREAASGLARSSDVLLKRLDMLTAQYQQSLQIILG